MLELDVFHTLMKCKGSWRPEKFGVNQAPAVPAGQIESVTHYEREQLQRHIVAAFGAAAAAAVTQNSPLSQRHGSLNDLWESSVVTSIEENKERGGGGGEISIATQISSV